MERRDLMTQTYLEVHFNLKWTSSFVNPAKLVQYNILFQKLGVIRYKLYQTPLSYAVDNTPVINQDTFAHQSRCLKKIQYQISEINCNWFFALLTLHLIYKFNSKLILINELSYFINLFFC